MKDPKEKATELINKFYDTDEMSESAAKKCAIICVNECIRSSQYAAHLKHAYHEFETTEFWMQVKTEINNL